MDHLVHTCDIFCMFLDMKNLFFPSAIPFLGPENNQTLQGSYQRVGFWLQFHHYINIKKYI